MFEDDTAALSSTRPPSPCFSSSWTSIFATASSNGPLPAMQRTGFAPDPGGKSRRTGRSGSDGVSSLFSAGALAVVFSGGYRRGYVLVINGIRDQLMHRLVHLLNVLRIEQSSAKIDLGEMQRLQYHLIVNVR